MAQSFHHQVKKLVIPANKQDAYVYKFKTKGIQRDTSKQNEGVWNGEPKGLAQYPLRTSPVKVWVFFYDHLKNTDILDGILDNNPNQGEFGFTCQNPSKAKPEEMVFFLPKTKVPDSYKPGGIWVYPDHKLENLKELDEGAAGFMAMGDKKDKSGRLDVGGQWQMMGHNAKVKLPKNKADLKGRQKKEPFGVKIRQKSTGEIFPVALPSSKTKLDSLKDKICSEKGIPSEDQRLSFNAKKLEGNKMLQEFGIKNGDIIDLEPMKVYVKNPSGKRFLFEVAPNEPVEDLMEKVEKKEGTPAEQQKLTFYRRKLDPAKTLADYRIKHMNVIDMEKGPPVKKARVFVEIPEGLNSEGDPKTRIKLDVAPTKTFGHLKKLVEEQTGVPKGRQRIFFQDKEVPDKRPIAKAKLKDGDTIRMEPVPEPEVEVKMPDGTSRQFFFDPDEPVKDFKERHKADFPPGTKLMFNDREMVDDDPMGKHKLKKGDVLLAEPEGVEIDTPRGKVLLSNFNSLTPSDIKDVIEEQTGVPKAQQRLFFFDEELVDDGKPIDKEKLNSTGTGGLRMEPEPPEVQITLPNGQSRAFFMDPANTVGDFKEKHRTDFPPGTKLMFNDREMVDEDPVGKYNLKKGDVLLAEPEELAVETPRGKVMLSTHSALTPSDIKDVIEEQTGVPKAQQRLFFFDEELVDDENPVDKEKLQSMGTQGLRMEPVPAEVQITLPNSQSRAFFMDPADTVADFKEKHKTDFPPGTKLMFHDREMVDEDPMGNYNLKRGDVLVAEPDDLAIETPRGKVMLSTHSMLTPSDIKDVIEEETGVPKAQQRLFFFDEELVDDDKPLDKSKIKSMGSHGLRMEPIPAEVKITMPNGKTRTYVVDPEQLVGDFKRKHKKQFPPGTKLMFDDREMVDEDPMGNYNLKKGDVLLAEPDDVAIETPRGKVMLSTHSILTPSDIKDVLEEQTGVPKSRQRLFYLDEELADDSKPLDKSKLLAMGTHGLRMEPVTDDDPKHLTQAKSSKSRAFYLSGPEEIEIMLSNGKKIALAITPTMTVEELKAVVEEKVPEMKESKQRLFFFDSDGQIDNKTPISKVMFDRGSPLEVKPFEITIKQKDCPSFQLYPDPLEYLDDIKDRIEEVTGIPPDSQYLTCMGSKLDDTLTLEAQAIGHMSRLTLEKMEIMVDTPDGKRIAVAVQHDESIRSIKEKLENIVQEPAQRLCILSGADQLEDDDTLESKGIGGGDILKVELFQVNFLHWFGYEFSVDGLTPNSTIPAMKQLIEEDKLILKEDQNFELKRRVLNSEETLRKQGVKHKSLLLMQEGKKIDIALPRKKKMTLTIFPTTTMGEMKKIIEEKIPGMKTKKQRLFVFDTDDEIDDDTPLSKLNFDSGHPLELRPMEISVQHSNGKAYDLPCAPSEYIEDVKDILEDLTGIEAASQRLTHNGKDVDDTLRLEEQGIVDGSVLLLERMRIFVGVPDGRKIRLRAELKDTIKVIKKKIAKKTGHHHEKQSIVLGGEDLDDKLTLGACNIDNGDEVTMETFRIDIIDGSDGATVTLADVARTDSIGIVRQHVWKQFNRRVDPGYLYSQQSVSALDDSSNLKQLGIPHRAILVIRIPKEKAAEYKADRFQFNKLFSTKKFDDIDEDIIMPVEPDWRTRTFIFDNDATPIDGFITISVLHWSGKSYSFHKVRPREKIKSIVKRIKKRRKCPVFHLLLNGKVLDESGRLLNLGVGHKSILVMEEKIRKSIALLPQVSKLNLGALNSLSTDKITVDIKLWNGDLLGLVVGATEYLDDIRDELCESRSIPVEYQNLSFEGEPVDDTLTLKEQEIKDGSLLVLEPLEIKINLPFKSTLSLQVEPEDTIAFIKQKIGKQTSFAANVQCLLFLGELLDDSYTIQDCKIQHEDELELEQYVVNILQLQSAKFAVSGDIHPGSTANDLQEIIAKRQLIPTHLQQLRLHGKLLIPSYKLSRQGVVHKSILILDVSSSTDQPQEKRAKVRLQVPGAPGRRNSNPELASPVIQRRKIVPAKGTATEGNTQAMNMPSPLLDFASADTNPAMRGRKTEKKNGKRCKSLDPAEANSRAVNQASESLDLASDSKPAMRGRKTDKKKVKRSKSVDPAEANQTADETSLKRGRRTDKKKMSKSVDESMKQADSKPAKQKRGKRPKSPKRSKSPKGSVDMSNSSQSLDLATADDDKPKLLKRGKRSSATSGDTKLGKLAGRVTIDKSTAKRTDDTEEEAPKKKGGWWGF